ncbi:hypothetical protein SESBI_48833 [Sesbania bispinosa]|nr:hypothetical protein SESBI_48833 [Sesbania bispinosa]
MKSSLSSSSHRPRMTCNCGEEVLLLMSSTKANPGKSFGGVQIGRAVKVVTFFRWCDEETGKDEVQKRLELEIADLEFKISKLRRKLMEERAVKD